MTVLLTPGSLVFAARVHSSTHYMFPSILLQWQQGLIVPISMSGTLTLQPTRYSNTQIYLISNANLPTTFDQVAHIMFDIGTSKGDPKILRPMLEILANYPEGHLKVPVDSITTGIWTDSENPQPATDGRKYLLAADIQFYTTSEGRALSLEMIYEKISLWLRLRQELTQTTGPLPGKTTSDPTNNSGEVELRLQQLEQDPTWLGIARTMSKSQWSILQNAVKSPARGGGPRPGSLVCTHVF